MLGLEKGPRALHTSNKTRSAQLLLLCHVCIPERRTSLLPHPLRWDVQHKTMALL